MRARICILFFLALVSVLSLLTSGPASAKRPVALPPEEVSLLFAVTGADATMRLLPGSGDRYAFAMRGADPTTVWFSDRPARLSGVLPTSGLIKQWQGFGFAAEPPNVAITLRNSIGSTDTIVAVMRRPSFNNGVLRATMQVLTRHQADSLTGNLAVHGDRSDPDGIPASIGSVSVFIDDAFGRVVGDCIIMPYASCMTANLAGANLAGANLERANLFAANLSGADLSGATLYSSNLGLVNFTGANLSGADLRYSHMISSGLSGANLSGTLLRGAIWKTNWVCQDPSIGECTR